MVKVTELPEAMEKWAETGLEVTSTFTSCFSPRRVAICPFDRSKVLRDGSQRAQLIPKDEGERDSLTPGFKTLKSKSTQSGLSAAYTAAYYCFI